MRLCLISRDNLLEYSDGNCPENNVSIQLISMAIVAVSINVQERSVVNLSVWK